MNQVNIRRIELINGEKILSAEVNRTIDKNQLERFRQLIKFNQSKKLNKKIDVMFTYSEVY